MCLLDNKNYRDSDEILKIIGRYKFNLDEPRPEIFPVEHGIRRGTNALLEKIAEEISSLPILQPEDILAKQALESAKAGSKVVTEGNKTIAAPGYPTVGFMASRISAHDKSLFTAGCAIGDFEKRLVALEDSINGRLSLVEQAFKALSTAADGKLDGVDPGELRHEATLAEATASADLVAQYEPQEDALICPCCAADKGWTLDFVDGSAVPCEWGQCPNCGDPGELLVRSSLFNRGDQE